MLGCGCSLRFGEGVEESVMEIVDSKRRRPKNMTEIELDGKYYVCKVCGMESLPS